MDVMTATDSPGSGNSGRATLKAYFALLVAVFVAVAAGASVYLFVQGERDGKREAEREAGFAARTAAGQLGDAVGELRASVEQVAGTPGIEQVLSQPEACTLSFPTRGGLQGHVDVLRSDGSVACSSREQEGEKALGGYEGASWLREARGGPLFQAPIDDPATNGHAALSAAPIPGGIVAGFLSLEPTAPALARLFGGGRPTEFLVTTRDGDTVLARSIDPGRWVGEPLEGTAFAEAGGDSERSDLSGTERVYADAEVPEVGWRLYAGEDEEAALSATRERRYRQLAIILAGLALFLLATFVVYRRVARPVRQLGIAVRATSEHPPLEPVPVAGPAEVTALGQDINGLIGAVNHELAERERAERDYRLLFASSPLPMWIHDLETRAMLDVNDAALERYGYSRDEFLSLGMGAIEKEPTRHRTHDGTVIDVRCIEHDVTFGGRPARFVLAEDVGERQRLEDQLRQAQRMEAIGRLAGGVAHDFNNLLTAIIGYSDLLLARMPSGDAHRTEAEEIKKAGERAVALTRQLLSFARGQAIRPIVMELNETIAGLGPMLRRVIRADIAIETSLAPDAGHVRADRGQIEQVVVNLAVNAGDAMPDGGTLTITTSSVELDADYFRLHPAGNGTPGRYTVLDVQDTGVGIDEETLAHVFEPFFTTKDAEKGTGLGLATVYGIVQQSEGFVWAYSELGRGSTFKIYLPTIEAAVERGADRAPQALLAAGGRTVLLVEDDPTVRSVVRLMLEAHGFAILEAEEGDAALALSEARAPGSLDLLVTDTVVPGPGGTALADRVRRRHPALRTVIMSGYSETVATGDVPLQPGTEFIAKPFGPADLNAKLTSLLTG